MSTRLTLSSCTRLCGSLLVVVLPLGAFAAGTTTSATTPSATVLDLSAPSFTVGTPITLDARVTAGGAIVHPGTVRFCDATAPHCEDAALLGEAQLTTEGIATVRLRPGIGSHSVVAVFAGTPGSASPIAGSQSTPVVFRISGSAPTLLSKPVAVQTPSGDYIPTTTLAAFGRPPVGGSVSFFDSRNGHPPVTLGTVPIVPGQATVGLTRSSSYQSGLDISTIATGDVNGDGYPDVLWCDIEAHTISVQLGKGDGTFAPPTVKALHYEPDVLKLADFNSDGILDVAITRRDNNDNSVEILLGNGDGSFTDVATVPTGRGPQDFTIADFNRDGIPDIATADLDGGTVSILLGKGDGNFVGYTRLSPAPEVWSIASGDFDGDGVVDLALVNFDKVRNFTVEVLHGDGKGGFRKGAQVPVVSDAFDLRVADFNNDGIPDLALISGDGVDVLLGDGKGGFPQQSSVSAGPGYYQGLSVADFNGDGRPDLAVSTFFRDGNAYSVVIFLANSDGSFSARSFPTFGSPWSATADFNGDGIPDLAVQDAVNDLTIQLGSQLFPLSVSSVLQPGVVHHLSAVYSGARNYRPATSPTATFYK